MRIAILLPDLRGGGAERVNLELAREFTRFDHRVIFVLMRAQGELLAEIQADCDIVDLGAPRIRQAYRPLRRWLKTQKPDVLLAGIWPLTVLAVMAAAGLGCRVVVSDHNVLSKQYERWGKLQNLFLRLSIRLAYPRAAARVGVSEGVARDIEALGSLRAGSVEVIHNPIPPASDGTAEGIAHAEASWQPDKGKRILTVGSFKAVKNHPMLLRAFARLAEETDAQLILLGDGKMRSDLERLTIILGIADRVVMPGFVSDPSPYYRTADLFVLSSDIEGFGNVIVEALACGTPVVSTDCPSGPAEILDGGRYGALVPVGDETALVEAMRAELLAEHIPGRLRGRARDFAPEIAAARYLDLLRGSSRER